jgi:hypothetical protein
MSRYQIIRRFVPAVLEGSRLHVTNVVAEAHQVMHMDAANEQDLLPGVLT